MIAGITTSPTIAQMVEDALDAATGCSVKVLPNGTAVECQVDASSSAHFKTTSRDRKTVQHGTDAALVAVRKQLGEHA